MWRGWKWLISLELSTETTTSPHFCPHLPTSMQLYSTALHPSRGIKHKVVYKFRVQIKQQEMRKKSSKLTKKVHKNYSVRPMFEITTKCNEVPNEGLWPPIIHCKNKKARKPSYFLLSLGENFVLMVLLRASYLHRSFPLHSLPRVLLNLQIQT